MSAVADTPPGLVSLLDGCARFDAEYGRGLSNHLPMALVALQRLGAPAARLAAFAQAYTQRLAPAPAAAVWPAGDAWTGRLGEPGAWPAYRALFTEWLAYEERANVLAQVLPALMPGCGAAAFHGLIRTSYAVQAGHDGELADALAYWAGRHLPLGNPSHGRQKDPAVLVTALQAAAVGWSSDKGLIFERMQEAAAVPAVARLAARLRVQAGTLEALARQAARLFADSGNFTALHLVTSAHAMRVLLPFIDEPETALGSYWLAFAAGLVSSGAQVIAANEPASWAELVDAALRSQDDHFIKLVDSCREEERAYGGDAWRGAASRALAQART